MKEKLKRLSFSRGFEQPQAAQEDESTLELKGRKKFPQLKGKSGAEQYKEFKDTRKLMPKPYLKAVQTDKFGHRVEGKEEINPEQHAEENYFITIQLKAGQNVSKFVFMTLCRCLRN